MDVRISTCRARDPTCPTWESNWGSQAWLRASPRPNLLAQLVDLVIGDRSIRASRKDPLCRVKAKPRPPAHFDSGAIQSHLSRGGHWRLRDRPVEDWAAQPTCYSYQFRGRLPVLGRKPGQDPEIGWNWMLGRLKDVRKCNMVLCRHGLSRFRNRALDPKSSSSD